MTVNFEEYQKDLKRFCKKHNQNGECKIETSPMINNCYHKNYIYDDGSNFTEINEIVVEEVEVKVHGIFIKVDVQLWRTEYYSTDDSKSKYFYQNV